MFIANVKLITHLYHQLKQEHFITIKLKLVICVLYYSTDSYVDYNFYTKIETDTLLADTLTNIGDISLPGVLDIGTSGYTNSRIRCNADFGGYTGYAELRAANSYDMFLNLPTAITDGGWMYFKINSDDYIQLSGGGNKVNIYKDTPSGNLDVSGIMNTTKMNLTNDVWDNFPLVITNTGTNWFQGEYIATANEVGCLFRYRTSGSSTYWWSVVWGSNTNDFNIWFNNTGLSIKSDGDVSISGNLDVGQDHAQTSIKAYFNHAGSTCHIRIEGRHRDQGFLHFETNYQYGEMFLTVRQTFFIRCSGYAGNPYVQTFQPLTQPSADRLKEHEIIIEHACET